MILHRKLALALTLALSTVAANASPLAYVLTVAGQFGTMDLSSGTLTPIGPGTAVGSGGLIPGPGGTLLTLGFDGTLNSINRTTGALTAIGATGLGDCSLPPASPCGANSANSFHKLGSTLYATDFANNLYSVDPTTGAATLIGSTGIPPLPFVPESLVPGDPDGSFYFHDESLFDFGGNLFINYDIGSFDPVTFTPTPIIAASLYQVNVTTGHATGLFPTTFGLSAITNVNGTVYGFSAATGEILNLNMGDGTTTHIGDYDLSNGLIEGAAPIPAPVPEPASLVLVGSGLAAVATAIRRRHRAQN
jgi:hypothetical protein